MKKVWILTTVLAAALLTVGLTAQAQTLLDYDTARHTLEISGTAQTAAQRFITFSVMPADVAPDTLTADNAAASHVLYRTAEAAEDGSFAEEITLPDTFPAGMYVLRTYEQALCGENYFAYTGGSFTATDLAAVNSAESAGQMLAALKELQNFTMDGAELTSRGNAIAGYLYQQLPTGGYTPATFGESYAAAQGMAAFFSGSISLEELLTGYSAYVPVDYRTEYAALPSAVQAETENLLSAKGISAAYDFADAYADAAATAQLRCTSSFAALQEAYLAYAQANNVSLSSYNGLATDYARDKVFIKLFAKIDTADDMQAVNTLFQSYVKEVASSTASATTSGSGGGGGGGGGGSSGSSTAFDTSVSATQQTVQASGFSDTAGHWAEAAILRMKQVGAVNGFADGSYQPDRQVTRAEFVKMLGVILGIDPGKGAVFADVTEGDWFYAPVYGAWAQGLVQGVTETEFMPDAPITRQDACVLLQRAWAFDAGAQTGFTDRDSISGYALPAVEALSANGVLTGYEDGTFRPQAPITRAETAVVFDRAMQAIGR